eukprot:GILI01012791.1.p1 GENE.GILI01012791.1~~GILI01012791.1.p1  ORF type:complete len:431 (-),score=32.13 GILI01012791.1:49-1224(-)
MLQRCGVHEIRIIYELADAWLPSPEEASKATKVESANDTPMPTSRARALTQPPIQLNTLSIDKPAPSSSSSPYLSCTAKRPHWMPLGPQPMLEHEELETMEVETFTIGRKNRDKLCHPAGFNSTTGTSTVEGSRVVFYGEMKPNLHEDRERSETVCPNPPSMYSISRKMTLNGLHSPVELKDDYFASSAYVEQQPLLSTATAAFAPATLSDSDLDPEVPALNYLHRRNTIAPNEDRHKSFFKGSTTNHLRPITPPEIQTVFTVSDESMEIPDEVRELQEMWRRIELDEQEEVEKLKRIIPWTIPLARPEIEGYSLAESNFFKSYVERNKVLSQSLSSSQMSSFVSDGPLSPTANIAKLWRATGKSGIVRRSSALSIETPSVSSSVNYSRSH